MDFKDQILELVRNVMGDESFKKAEDQAKTESFYNDMKERLEKEFGGSGGRGEEKAEEAKSQDTRKPSGNPILDGFLKNFEEALKKCGDFPSLEAAVQDFLKKLEAAAKIFRS
jgi:hypothetical protein